MNSSRISGFRKRLMIGRTLCLGLAVLGMSLAAKAQDEKADEALVQTLMADPKALADALRHCKPDSLTEDRDCHAAQVARNRQFFGTGTVPYTPQMVDPFPTNPTLTPAPRKP